MSNRLLRAVWAVTALAGCQPAPPSTPPTEPPPFRVEQTGPGLEIDNPGRKLRWTEGDRDVGSLRLSRLGVRVFDAQEVRHGRLRPDAGAYVVEGREGNDLCSVQLNEGSGAVLDCAERGRIELSVVDGPRVLVAIDGLNVGLAEGSGQGATFGPVGAPSVRVVQQGPEYAVEAGPWRRTLNDPVGAVAPMAVALSQVHLPGDNVSQDAALLRAALLWAADRLLAGQNGPPSAAGAAAGSGDASAVPPAGSSP